MTNFLGIVYKGSQNCTDLTCSSFLSEELYVDIQVDSLGCPWNRAWMQNLCVESVNDFSLVCQIMQMKEYNYLQLRWAMYWNALLFCFLFFQFHSFLLLLKCRICTLLLLLLLCLSVCVYLTVSLSFMCVFALRSWTKYIKSTASADVRIQLGNCNSLFSVRASSCL